MSRALQVIAVLLLAVLGTLVVHAFFSFLFRAVNHG